MLRVDAFVCVRPSKLFRRCTKTKPHTIQMPHNKGETNWVQLQLGLPFEILIAKEWMVSEVDGRWIYDARCCRLIASCKIACSRQINWTFRIMTVLIRFVQLNWSLPIGDGLSLWWWCNQFCVAIVRHSAIVSSKLNLLFLMRRTTPYSVTQKTVQRCVRNNVRVYAVPCWVLSSCVCRIRVYSRSCTYYLNEVTRVQNTESITTF